MSLIAWYPLNGDLKNYGVGDMELTVSSTPTFVEGKIGKASSFNGSSNFYKTNKVEGLGDNCTISCWVYTKGGSTGTIACCRNAVGNGFAIFLLNGNQVRFDLINTGGAQWETGYTMPLNTWAHLAFTRTNTKAQLYVNGKLYKEKSYSNTPASNLGNVITIGASQANGAQYNNWLNGMLNDFRIYNTALSPKEIHEISKGLILHYPMNGVDGIVGGRNLVKKINLVGFAAGVNFDDYAKNGTITFLSKSNGNAGFHFDSVNMYTPNNYYTLSFNMSVTNGKFDKASYWHVGKTISEVKLYVDSNYYGDTYGLNENAIKIFDDGKFHKVVITYKISNTAVKPDAGTDFLFVQPYRNVDSLNAVVTIKGFKLELGTKSTLWTPAPEDMPTVFSDNNTVYDTSGYGNNGTKSGSIGWDSDAPIGYGAWKLGNNYIQAPLKISSSNSSYTFNFWVKPSRESTMYFAWDNSNNLNIFSYDGNSYLNTGDSRDNSLGVTMFIGQWHMYTYVFDNGVCKAYRDEVHLDNAKTFRAFNTNNIRINGWWNDNDYRDENGLFEDYRVYATALSEADIQELYKTRFSISDDGKLTASGVSEV